MDIVNATEICALSLEKENQIENAESLRQKISNVISKNIHFKIRNNLAFEQGIALKELSQNTENKVYSYDKGTGFVILNNKDAIRKTEEQIRESIVSNTDPTSVKVKKKRKKNKFTAVCEWSKKLACKKRWSPKVLWYRKSLSPRPINKPLNVLIDQLNNDKDDLMKRTKLCLKDIYELAELCLSGCYFCGTMKLEY